MLSAELRAVHIHPVGSPAAQAVGEAVVEPWGLDGDRRWMPAGTAGKVVTRRQQPRTALISAPPLAGWRHHAGRAGERGTDRGGPGATGDGQRAAAPRAGSCASAGVRI
ncbi:MOSC domain-containing protein [Streptomyces sp. NBC_01463]